LLTGGVLAPLLAAVTLIVLPALLAAALVLATLMLLALVLVLIHRFLLGIFPLPHIVNYRTQRAFREFLRC
jgi:hypothetical protein